jgi:DNA sulfur modification protein DndC
MSGINKYIEIKENVKKVYKAYNRPFVIGYSGGKDSTTTLQIIWEAIEELPKEDLINEVFVISVDTLVETPYIVSYINSTIENINKSAIQKKLPIKAVKLTPKIINTFWVNLIGKGYPAPSQMFRWCTERLKIEPVNRFIQDSVSKYGEVTIVLGARASESISRGHVLEKKKRDKFGLSLHKTLSSAYVFTPIEKLTDDEVWEYLLKNPYNQWNGNNRDLSAMYKNASGGECPLVVDTSTPSCGNSRFGCWTCTLVRKDTSMENLIDSGEEWMLPLLEFRNLLSETQEPDKKQIYRSRKNRKGKTLFIKNTESLSFGPYKFEWRQKFLKNLLEIEKDIQIKTQNKSVTLISHEELLEIRKIWKCEEYDWEDSVLGIYKSVYNKQMISNLDDGVYFSQEDFLLLQDLCNKNNTPIGMVAKLIDLERKIFGISKRSGIIDKIDTILSEEWRSENEIIIEKINKSKKLAMKNYEI